MAGIPLVDSGAPMAALLGAEVWAHTPEHGWRRGTLSTDTWRESCYRLHVAPERVEVTVDGVADMYDLSALRSLEVAGRSQSAPVIQFERDEKVLYMCSACESLRAEWTEGVVAQITRGAYVIVPTKSGEFAGVGAGQRELYAEVIPWCCGKRLQKAPVIEE